MHQLKIRKKNNKIKIKPFFQSILCYPVKKSYLGPRSTGYFSTLENAVASSRIGRGYKELLDVGPIVVSLCGQRKVQKEGFQRSWTER